MPEIRTRKQLRDHFAKLRHSITEAQTVEALKEQVYEIVKTLELLIEEGPEDARS